MTAKDETVTFLSCFKCGRIVRSTDPECPRCGMKFGPGTLFECPFCAGLVWRSADTCSTCRTDLIKFSKEIEEHVESFSMDGFVDEILQHQLDDIKEGAMKVACPSCGLMIRGDEERCPRCKMKLQGAKVDCPVCGEKVLLSDEVCWNCGASFFEETAKAEDKAEEERSIIRERMSEGPDEEVQKIRAILETAKKTQEKEEKEKKEKSPKEKKRRGFKKK